MKTGLLYLFIYSSGYIASLSNGPFWGLIIYAIIYFLHPIGGLRWGLITSVILVISLFLHQDKLSKSKIGTVYWGLIFWFFTLIISKMNAVDPVQAEKHTYMLLTYCICMYIIIRALARLSMLRNFMVLIVVLAGKLSLHAYLVGARVHGRLEGIGPGDSAGANQFGILLAAILPLAIPFIIRGKLYERIICLLALPFILNAIGLCSSRGVIISFLLGCLYVFLIVADKKIKKYIFIAGLCGIPVMYYFSDPFFIDRMSNMLTADSSDEMSLNTLSSGRLLIWNYGWEMVKDYPFGAGPEGFRALARFYLPEEILTFQPGAEFGVRAAHNSYLQVLIEQGIIGLAIFMAICFYTMFLLFSCFKRLKHKGLTTSFWGFAVIGLNISFVLITSAI